MHLKTLQSNSIPRVIIEMEALGLMLFHHVCGGFNEAERERKMERNADFDRGKKWRRRGCAER